MTTTPEELRIDKLVYGGDGLGRLPSGEVMFIPWSAPGDQLRVQRQPGSKKPTRGKLEQILEPGPNRTEPACSVFGVCGGCQWQHVTPAAQRDWKRQIVQESLQRIGKLPDTEVLETIGTDDEAWHYRNRVQWEVRQGRLGYYKAQSHEVVAFDHCWIIPEPLNQLADWLQSYFDRNPPEGLARIEVVMNPDNQMLLSLEGKASGWFKPFSQALREAVPAVIGVVHVDADDPQAIDIISGEDTLIMPLAGKKFQVSAGSFFQTNTAMAERMLDVLNGWLPSDASSLLDAYAGVGTFALAFQDRFAQILAVESAPNAVADARHNLGLNQAHHVQMLTGDAAKVLPRMQERFDVTIVDPPRAGNPAPVLDWLAEHTNRQIIMVSCNPTTLARDLKHLAERGWRATAVQPLDMFPQTYHVETLVRLEKTS